MTRKIRTYKQITMSKVFQVKPKRIKRPNGTFVTYWKFRRQLFTDTITKERLNFIKDWRECAACFCGLLALKNESFKVDEFEGHKLEYYYYKLLLMCNSTKPESYVDIEVVKQLNLLYQAKGKVSNEQFETAKL